MIQLGKQTRRCALLVAAALSVSGNVLAQTAPAQPAQPQPDASPATPVPPTDTGQPAGSTKQAPAPAAPAPAGANGPAWTTLRLLYAKGMISEDEYQSALKDIQQTGAADSMTAVIGKIKTTIYGYTEANFKYDSTESCVDICGGAQIAKSDTYRGNHGRMIFGPRDTRIGLRFMAPEEHGIRVSGNIETDFFGPTTTTEQGTWSNPVLRIRTSYVKLETPVLDFLIGQNWSLFGWQPYNLIESVQLPGLPGQMFDRGVQLKVSKTIKTDAVTAEIAAAAMRPPQIDSATPDGQAGIRLQFNNWKGLHSIYQVFTAVQPAWIGLSGDLRQLRIPELSTTPHHGIPLTGGGFSAVAFIPLIPATAKSRDNALAIQGEFDVASGTADEFAVLGGVGTANPTLPPAMMGGQPIPYPSNFDPGIAAIDPTGHAELIKWTNWLLNAEYCLPGLDGRVELFGNWGHQESSNAKSVGTAVAPANATPAQTAAAMAAVSRIRDHEDLYEGGLSFDITSSSRIAASGAVYNDTYGDGSTAKNYSVMFSGWLFY